jgi:hypothetical protein
MDLRCHLDAPSIQAPIIRQNLAPAVASWEAGHGGEAASALHISLLNSKTAEAAAFVCVRSRKG